MTAYPAKSWEGDDMKIELSAYTHKPEDGTRCGAACLNIYFKNMRILFCPDCDRLIETAKVNA